MTIAVHGMKLSMIMNHACSWLSDVLLVDLRQTIPKLSSTGGFDFVGPASHPVTHQQKICRPIVFF